MGQALYRKYRSRSLGEVVGQEHITTTLANALKAGRISHAYLFTGPRGVGKTSIARILAFEINKLPYSDTPHLDIVEIDAASNRRIDDIRDLREKVHITPISAPYKVYIIDEVHMLTGESFNALLKTLEEPPAHVVFILATTEVHKLPATIISRTQRFTFRPADPTKLVAHLKSLAQKENITITDDALELIAQHGDGSFRDSVSLLDQLANISDGNITVQSVAQTLGLAPQDALKKLVDALIKGDHRKVNAQLQELENAGTSASALVPQLARALSANGSDHPQLYGLVDQLLDVPRAYNPGLKLMAVLLRFASQGQGSPAVTKPSKTVAELITRPAVLEMPVPLKTHQPASTEPSQQPPKPKVDTPPANPAAPPLNELTSDQWAQLLTKVKGTNIPLHSVLKHAQPQFDQATQTLTLFFKYQLHRKKLDDAKQKSALAQFAHAILGANVAITTQVGSAAPLTSDPAVANVAAIMGGGELINAQI